MKISERFQSGKPVISFEFFPPKTDGGFTALFRTIAELQELQPGFVSVTMGAGGSTRSKTVDLERLQAGERGGPAVEQDAARGRAHEDRGLAPAAGSEGVAGSDEDDLAHLAPSSRGSSRGCWLEPMEWKRPPANTPSEACT